MYKQIKYQDQVVGVYKEENGVRISFGFTDPANTDFQEYQRWLAEGHVPTPADEQPTE